MRIVSNGFYERALENEKMKGQHLTFIWKGKTLITAPLGTLYQLARYFKMDTFALDEPLFIIKEKEVDAKDSVEKDTIECL